MKAVGKLIEVDFLSKYQVFLLSCPIWFLLKDLFCNHKLEFDISLSDLKIAFENLGLSQPMPAFAIQNEPNKPFASRQA
jgi:hypothetical protein